MKITQRWILASGLVLAANAHAASKLRYVILADQGKQIGEQVVERADDGLTRVHYVFKNNGRGPELDEQIRLAPDGTPSDYQVKGATMFGSTVDERFVRKGDDAQWQSTSEEGETQVSGTALYVPINGSLEVISAAIGALSQRPDNTLPLLPTGSLKQRKLDEVEVEAGGQKRKVQLLALTGQGLAPAFFWATVEARPRLFAQVVASFGFMLTIEDGWQSNGPLLTTRQKAAEIGLLKEMAAKLAQPLSGLSVVRNARVFDSEKAVLGAPSDVYVLRGRITAVLPAGSPMRGVDNEIDAAGRVLLPGLYDMHGHFDRWDGGLHLAAGVTTVRDMGNDNTNLQQAIDQIASGELLAPQIVPAGFLEGESAFSARYGFIIKDLAKAKEAIDWYAEHGYPQLKIYNSFPKEILAETVSYAHSRGLRVSGHVPAFLRAQDVAQLGFDEIQHINQVLLNFFVTPTTDTRTLDRFYLPAEKTADLDFDSKPVQDFLALLKKHQIVVDPTVAVFNIIHHRDGESFQTMDAVSSHLPIDLQRSLRGSFMKIPDEATAQRYTASYNKMIEFVGRMYRAGIPIVAGTDSFAGFTLHSELELYVQAGLTPAQALQIATLNGARYTRTLDDRGSIAAGKRADLVLVDGDPTRSIGDLRKIALVITQGKLISPSAVYQALGIQPFVDQVPTLKAVTAH